MNDTSSLDEILDYVCDDLQLSPTNHQEAERAYKAVAKWLAAPESELHVHRPTIYPQGSFLIGTTVHPIGRNEYDLDFVCEMEGLNWTDANAIDVLNAVEKRLRGHGTYQSMVEPLKRCIRLTYANEFHMDILPAAPEIPKNGTRVLVPDRKLEEWKASNPKGYAEWFHARSKLYTTRLQEKRIEPMPRAEDADDKTPLQRAVQLIKRARDRYYLNRPGDAPRSIVLTTLAAQAYSGTASTAQALHEILYFMSGSAVTEVRNPANSDEVLSEQWSKDPQSLVDFKRWVSWFAAKWNEAVASRGTNLSAKLFELFGEDSVKAAYVKQAKKISDLRGSGNLGISRAGSLASAAAAVTPVPRNTFYGA